MKKTAEHYKWSGYIAYLDGSIMGLRGKFLAPYKKENGYYYVSVSNGNATKRELRHRFIWEAFNGPIPEGLQINHIDGNKANNSLANLELVTRSENMLHAYSTGLRDPKKQARSGSYSPNAALTEEQVREIILTYASGEMGCRRLGKKFGVSSQNIRIIVKRRGWLHVWDALFSEGLIS